MENFATWIGGLIPGLLLAVAGQVIGHFFQHGKGIREKLLERYADFMGAATEELGRARDIEAKAELMPTDVQLMDIAKQGIEQRHALRRNVRPCYSNLYLGIRRRHEGQNQANHSQQAFSDSRSVG
jgi:hypothetical protein